MRRAGGDLPPNPTLAELEALVAAIDYATIDHAALALGRSTSTIHGQLARVRLRVGALSRAHAAWLLWPVLRDAWPDPPPWPARLPDRRQGQRRRSTPP